MIPRAHVRIKARRRLKMKLSDALMFRWQEGEGREAPSSSPAPIRLGVLGDGGHCLGGLAWQRGGALRAENITNGGPRRGRKRQILVGGAAD